MNRFILIVVILISLTTSCSSSQHICDAYVSDNTTIDDNKI